MASLDDTEISILLMLAEEAGGVGKRLKAEAVAARFTPKLGARIADLSLRHLKECGFVDAAFDNPGQSGYAITRLGLQVVEKTCERTEDGANTNWRRKAGVPDSVASMNLQQSVVAGWQPKFSKGEINWTKWGTILTAFAIMVTILIAVLD